jgi:hypothetical protein
MATSNLVTHHVPIRVSDHSFHRLKPKIKIYLANADVALIHMMLGHAVASVSKSMCRNYSTIYHE